ncbi:hypothetical protein [Bradyrhizobium sp. sBnM-33]|uniref:hypothetical protein n=1 Tax=Bradyrhizobium sp. sBnM-33 TaxID=2831780 RepID=UPI001BCD7CEC|nr:hypothetical protein [Bradyrhizobium sp. sBnM-33]WOH49236.1 hypothetical protein RX328_34965 [Bradyrhizobium sp. sBnM-33]
MANQNGKKYGFTGLFPIKVGQTAELRTFLRRLDLSIKYPRGSPLSEVPIVHMARFVVIDRLAYQGTPAKVDTLKSAYLLFACDFDGFSIDVLIRAMVKYIPCELEAIWQHCRGFPGIESCDDLAAYFEQCQITTNLLLADQPNASVNDILKGLMYRRRLAEFIRHVQDAQPNPADLKADFERMWQSLQEVRPSAGEL